MMVGLSIRLNIVSLQRQHVFIIIAALIVLSLPGFSEIKDMKVPLIFSYNQREPKEQHVWCHIFHVFVKHCSILLSCLISLSLIHQVISPTLNTQLLQTQHMMSVFSRHAFIFKYTVLRGQQVAFREAHLQPWLQELTGQQGPWLTANGTFWWTHQ